MKTTVKLVAVALLAFVAGGTPTARAQDTVLQVLATTTDLRELAKEVGGPHVEVTCLMKGPEDPHFLEARPSFVRAAAKADVLLLTGMELEIGYAPLLLSDSRNEKIQKGKPGYVDCSDGIDPLAVPEGTVDRSMGDVHSAGNPHYMTDPVRGKIVAGTIAAHFAQVDPDHAEVYKTRLAAFRRRVDVAMFGERILLDQPAERLERKLKDGTLAAFLKERDLTEKLDGFAKALLPFSGRKVAVYHSSFLYLLERFHLSESEKIEPKPGVAPSPKHLALVIAAMRRDSAKVVLYMTAHPAETARAVAEQADGRAVLLAHQPDAVSGTASYLDAVAFNVASLATALRETAATK